VTVPQPYQPHPYQQPREGFVITTQYFPLSWLFATVNPVLTVNGWPVRTGPWGRNVVPASPGEYLLHVHTPYFLPKQLGPADYRAVLPPGQWIELEYKAPLWSFSKGSVGPPPQSYKGVVPTVALIGGCLALIALMMILSVAF